MNVLHEDEFQVGAVVLRETFASVMRSGEAAPLIRAHGEEIGLTRLPYRWQPALNLYRDLENQDRLIWLSVRDESFALIGYAMYLLGPSTHFSGRTHANLEAVYVSPGSRSVALARQLWQEGVKALRLESVTSLTRAVWARRGGGHPIQVVRWTFLEE